MILQKGTAIDIPKLKAGAVVQTLFAKTQMMIYCIAPLEYKLLVRTSFKDYTEKFLRNCFEPKMEKP